MIFVSRLDLIVVVNRPGIDGILHSALGAVRVRCPESAAHRIQSNAELVEQIGINFRSHRRMSSASHKHLAYSAHLRQLLRQHGIGGVIHLRQGVQCRR